MIAKMEPAPAFAGHVRHFNHNRRAEYARKLRIANATSDATTTTKYDSGCYIHHVNML